MYDNLTFAGFAVRATISFAGLVFAWQVVYVPTMVDELRQALFSLRRELFLLVSRNQISATHPAYASLRTRINRMIQFAEQVSAWRALLIMPFCRSDVSDYRAQAEEQIASINEDGIRQMIQSISDRMGHAVTAYLKWTSLTVWLIAAILFAVVLVALPFILIASVVSFAIKSLKFVANLERTGNRIEMAWRYLETFFIESERRVIFGIEAEAKASSLGRGNHVAAA